MLYRKTVTLKDGTSCLIKNPEPDEAAEVVRSFITTHGETEFLSSYPDEAPLTEESERKFIESRNADERAIELCAYIDGVIVATAGFSPVGRYEKLRHRAEYGVSVERAYWGRGIGRALTDACIQCAVSAGFTQLELEAVADNKSAISLYESAGFVEYGRNPKGFKPRSGGWQEIVLMAKDLTE